MFNKNVVNVFSQLTSIGNNVIMRYPYTVLPSNDGDMMVLVDISKLDSTEFTDFGLMNSLSEFLNLFKLMGDEPKVSMEDNIIYLEGTNGAKSTYITSSIALMDAFDKNPLQFEKTKEANSVADFTLTIDDLKSLKGATSVFKDLTEIIISSQDGDVTISLGATNRFNARSNTFGITKKCGASKDFEVKIPCENLKLIPNSEYNFSIKYNERSQNPYRLYIENSTLNAISIIMTVKM